MLNYSKQYINKSRKKKQYFFTSMPCFLQPKTVSLTTVTLIIKLFPQIFSTIGIRPSPRATFSSKDKSELVRRRLRLIEELQLGLMIQHSDQQVVFTQSYAIGNFNDCANLKHSEKMNSVKQRPIKHTKSRTIKQHSIDCSLFNIMLKTMQHLQNSIAHQQSTLMGYKVHTPLVS